MPYQYRFGSHGKAKSVADSQAHLLPHGLSWSILPGCGLLTRCRPFFTTAGMLMHLNAGAVQHEGRFIDNILLDQLYQNVLPYAGFCPCSKSTVYALPGAKSLGQISSGNASVQPIHHGVKHLPIALCRPASLGFSFWGKQIFDSVPLCFAQFMSSHTFSLPDWHFPHNFSVLKRALEGSL